MLPLSSQNPTSDYRVIWSEIVHDTTTEKIEKTIFSVFHQVQAFFRYNFANTESATIKDNVIIPISSQKHAASRELLIGASKGLLVGRIKSKTYFTGIELLLSKYEGPMNIHVMGVTGKKFSWLRSSINKGTFLANVHIFLSSIENFKNFLIVIPILVAKTTTGSHFTSLLIRSDEEHKPEILWYDPMALKIESYHLIGDQEIPLASVLENLLQDYAKISNQKYPQMTVFTNGDIHQQDWYNCVPYNLMFFSKALENPSLLSTLERMYEVQPAEILDFRTSMAYELYLKKLH